MKNLIKSVFIFLVLVAITNSVFANDGSTSGSITITSPMSDTVLQSATENKLEFKIQLSPSGNHVHVYIDEQDPIVFRNVSHCPCSIALPKLASGKHTLVIKEATSSHAMTGLEGKVIITVK